MSAPAAPLHPDDVRALAARGVAEEEAHRQLALLAEPPDFARLERPCTPGDGIVRLSPGRLAELRARHAADAAAGRVMAFVPASGAATRMFRDLLAALDTPGGLGPDGAATAAVCEYVAGLPRFAFFGALAENLAARGLDVSHLREHGPWRPLLEALLAPDGLDYARLPKALLAFHRTSEGARTAFEEHLAEGASLVRDAEGRCRMDFTVSPEHRAGFVALLASAGTSAGARDSARWEVAFREQHPSTDTLALGTDGQPFRDAGGALLFRPAGHGALLRNLGDSGGDLVFLKNIDNVAVDRCKEETLRWAAALLGLASELAGQAQALRARLGDRADAAAVADTVRWRREALGDPAPPATREALADSLDRPVRVCGMVPNTGEPGGGPFWVRRADGAVTRQIVESAQVAPEAEQQALLRAATHFNPVFLACALRDRTGRGWDLDRFVDDRAVIVTRKSWAGRDLLALERPGLWNGAMAHWTTLFVEVPLAVFNPVKTVLDLLRPEHQG
jgi:hypothetical protein